ncbi:type ISP restriction/modification enzyme [Alkalihalobacillus sp. FSL R5-0424]
MELTNHKSFINLLKEIDKREKSQRDRGTLFELLTIPYLEKEPLYARYLDEVWKLSDVPSRYNISKKDIGVDLVAKIRGSDDLVAIQCKYFDEDKTIRKADIDSFLNEVGKSYYSEGIIITTTDKWSKNANDALSSRNKIITRISLSDLQDSQINWAEYSFDNPKNITVKKRKTPRPHQRPAIEAVYSGFKKADRGKLIMAPGTGKTYTSMAIAEKMAADKNGVFRVLYLVPSIQLLSQTLRGWNADISCRMDTIAVCSDRKVTKEQNETELEDIISADIGFPATTSTQKLLDYQYNINNKKDKGEFLAVFSTYQSIDVLIEAQKQGFYEFDLIICDEAHRTTGATENIQQASTFTKVHSNNNIKSVKRLYQTATPRVYGEEAKKKAEEMSVLIADMGNTSVYGEEFYRLGFGDAIREGILTDYKVMVLAVDEEAIARTFQDILAKDKELMFDDITKIIGCWNGLVKRKNDSDEALGDPMKRAIAFAGTIKESKLISEMFSNVVDQYIYSNSESEETYRVEVDHADGSMNALEKNKKISWLKGDVPDKKCRILSNARFLTEGVDIPDLDAVMFLKPRKSKIDIAQAVGRVMRKAEGKDYGYVILPIGVPAGKDAHSVLNGNEKYKVVWDVLNALRSIDERFDSTINKLELNKKKPSQIQIIGVGDAPKTTDGLPINKRESEQLSFIEDDLSEIEKVIYGKIVKKVGNVRYWEQWSEDVAKIAQTHMMRIKLMLEDKNSEAYNEFNKFVKSLRFNINSSITELQAIEMLSQHLITKPVFEALFDSYSFVNNNPVSNAIESILNVLDKQGLSKEQEKLSDFYESVRLRAKGIDNLKAKQDIIIQLYDKFFKIGFKETTDRLGIVFTPTEVVDFLIQSVNDILKKYFGKTISSRGVHILDPFTGTGTFIVRLIQSGVIDKVDLLRKYTEEIHANEIVLLSYYIAAINIEETFHSINNSEYIPYNGIVLTDTFEIMEHRDTFHNELFTENNERLNKQMENSIFAIIGNPPYSSGQNDANDNNKNQKYSRLEESITKTYAKNSKAVAKNTLYDSYIKAFRWASDRISEKGIIAFVTNGSFIDSRGTDGLRKCWYEEFNYIYIFNLRGDQRTVGEKSREEGGKIFGSGSRTPIAVTILVKDGSENKKIYYNDIGDYLSREQKLQIVSEKKSITNIEWKEITPDSNNDWINQRDLSYSSFHGIDTQIFKEKAIGVGSKRDTWVYGFSKDNIINNCNYLVNNYNSEVVRLSKTHELEDRLSLVNNDQKKIKWSRSLLNKFKANKIINLDNENIIKSMYRPFTKKYLFYQREIVDMPGRYKDFFGERNKLIYITKGATVGNFSALVTNLVPAEVALGASGTGFLYELKNKDESNLLGGYTESNISDDFLKQIDLDESKTFNYIYAVLNSKEYKKIYANDLSKELPKIPILEEIEEYIKIGEKLVDLHLNYEKIEACSDVKIVTRVENPSYKVKKMKHPKRGQTDTIVFNHDITITDIPQEAYYYQINGRSAIAWVMDQYQIKVDKKSGIEDDPNVYSDNEKYIFNLLLSIINVSLKTIKLINKLPEFKLKSE